MYQMLLNNIKSRLAYAFLVCMMFVSSAIGQISPGFYKSLPDSLKPKNILQLTLYEKERILSEINRPGEIFMPEFRRICNSLEAGLNIPNAPFDISTNKSVGDFYRHIREYTTSLRYYYRVVNGAQGNRVYDSISARCWLKMGSSYMYLARYDSAIECLNKGLDMLESDKPASAIFEYYNNLFYIYENLGLWEKAIYACARRLDAFKQFNSPGEIYVAQTTFMMGVMYANFYDETGIIKYRDSASGIFQKIMEERRNDSAWYGACYYYKSILQYSDGNYKQALILLDSSLLSAYNQYSTNFTGPYVYYYGKYLYKGICLLKLGQYREGISILDTIRIPDKRFVHLKLLNLALYEYARLKGNWKDAVLYHERVIKFSDSLSNVSLIGKVLENNQKYDLLKKQSVITNLENESLKKENENEHLINIGLFISLALMSVIGFLYFTYKNQRQKSNREKQEIAAELERMGQETLKQLMKVQMDKEAEMDQQRKLISSDLHDGLASSLLALKYYISDKHSKSINPKEQELLANIEEEVNGIYEQGREYLHYLHNSETKASVDLVGFLNMLSKRFSRQEGFYIRQKLNLEAINEKLNANQKNQLYFIIKEAITNTLKHAGAAASLTIFVGFETNKCLFHISDDNTSRNTMIESDYGIGLKSITDRIGALKGEVHIQQLAAGFLIYGSFPL